MLAKIVLYDNKLTDYNNLDKPMDYQNIYHLVVSVFGRANVPFLLVGGFAVNYYKATRMTVDLDTLTTEANFEKTLPYFEKAGYPSFAKYENFCRLRPSKSGLMDIDVLFVDEETFSGMWKECQEVFLEGIQFRVPSLRHLIAMKLHSVKNNRKREFRDLGDIVELVKRNDLDVFSHDFKDLCLKYGTSELYRKIQESQKK